MHAAVVRTVARSAATLLLLTFPFLSAVQAAPAGERIKLGLNYPATGRYKEEGIAQAQGALMAIEEINAAGGVLGRPLELLTANTASDPAKAVEKVKALAKQPGARRCGGPASPVSAQGAQGAPRHPVPECGRRPYAPGACAAVRHGPKFPQR